ncbi:MAG: hypothetical protein L6R28_07325 [Planctomycetes bacterium]|nr:hypothetical protein [Planctomycetota bacterium]
MFRGLLPPALVRDLRREADKARILARKVNGPQAQRLQPLSAYDIDLRPFQDYRDLPELREALAVLFNGLDWSVPALEDRKFNLGILVEPGEQPWCTPWHRDWRDHVPASVRGFVEQNLFDRRLFLQVNCALYADESLWVVPGSHLRLDLPSEIAAFPTQPPQKPELDGLGNEEREAACLAYCKRMPGGVPLHLQAGDYAIYRDVLWHLGNYVPYRRRATLHDLLETPEYAAFRDKVEDLRQATHRPEAAVAS